MATNVKFAYGSTIPTISNSKFTDGTIYFNTNNQKIYMRHGNSVHVFDGKNTVGRTNIGLSNNTTTFVNPAAVHIQDAPTKSYSSSYTSSISGCSSWYSLFGQGKVSSSTLVDYGFSNGCHIDESLADQAGTMVATLCDAKEIVFGVDLINLARALNNGTAVSGTIDFGYTPADVIVTCYRTTENEFATSDTTDYQGTPGGAMFVGKVLLGLGINSSSSAGAGASLCSLTISLCMNASNAVSVNGRVFTIASGSQSNTSKTFSGSSGRYAYDGDSYETYYPNIEKHLYPLYIRYI